MPFIKGHKSGMTGKFHNNETKNKISLAHKGKVFSLETRKKMSLGRLEAHHILNWREYPELRYDINNGITLCHAHHPRKRAEEKRMVSYFTELLSVSKE
jgi:NUMOD3 motif-containing protein